MDSVKDWSDRWMCEKMIAACGNDCSLCPRYAKAPYEKTETELEHTAQLWFRIGYRDHVVSKEEISCMGCKEDNWCRYNIVRCASEKQIENCGYCREYPCEKLRDCFEVTKSFEPSCKKICTREEYRIMQKAFFEKEQNLDVIRKKKVCIRSDIFRGEDD